MKRGKQRKLDPTVEDEWRSEHGDTTNYGGQDGRLWRSAEMRARDTANQPMEKCGDESTRHSQPWRRRRSAMEEKRGKRENRDLTMEEKRGKNGKRGVERGREQVENEGREGTNGKMG